MEPILFHLSFGIELFYDTPEFMIKSFTNKVLIPSFIISFIILICEIIINKKLYYIKYKILSLLQGYKFPCLLLVIS